MNMENNQFVRSFDELPSPSDIGGGGRQGAEGSDGAREGQALHGEQDFVVCNKLFANIEPTSLPCSPLESMYSTFTMVHQPGQLGTLPEPDPPPSQAGRQADGVAFKGPS